VRVVHSVPLRRFSGAKIAPGIFPGVLLFWNSFYLRKPQLPQRMAYCILLACLKNGARGGNHALQILVIEKNIIILVFCFFLFRSIGVHAEPLLKFGIHAPPHDLLVQVRTVLDR
jgi:hypothetical protein